MFFDPIELPGGRKLVTLCDAAHYITNLPKAEHDAKEWQAAMEALLLVAERDGDRVRLVTRVGYNWTDRYPLISAAARKLKAPFFVIDGEAVWLDPMANVDLNQRTDLDRTTM
jgi:hypothetical protein